MNIILVTDRFEGKYAILECQEKNPLIFNFPRHLLPQEAKEGTVLNINIDIDQEETKIIFIIEKTNYEKNNRNKLEYI